VAVNDPATRGAEVRPARSIDANLLPALHALLEERNLVRAGTRLTMSQAAIGGALTRLRRYYDDQLLVRRGGEYALTPLAEKLRPAVAAAVAAAERLVAGTPTFSPGTAQRTFLVSLTEYALSVLAAPLVRILGERAPHVGIDFTPIPTDPEALVFHLLRQDLIIGAIGFGIPGRRQPVFTDEFVCVVSRGNARLHEQRLTATDLAQMPHVVARFGPSGTTRAPDEIALEEFGLRRRVQIVVPGLLTLPAAVAGTECCAFVPRRLALRCLGPLGLVIAGTPLPPITMVEAAHWHPSRGHDPALSWLRGILYDVAVTVESALD
jgi:DNA-binding transcriptional LysR family regulator